MVRLIVNCLLIDILFMIDNYHDNVINGVYFGGVHIAKYVIHDFYEF